MGCRGRLMPFADSSASVASAGRAGIGPVSCSGTLCGQSQSVVACRQVTRCTACSVSCSSRWQRPAGHSAPPQECCSLPSTHQGSYSRTCSTSEVSGNCCMIQASSTYQQRAPKQHAVTKLDSPWLGVIYHSACRKPAPLLALLILTLSPAVLHNHGGQELEPPVHLAAGRQYSCRTQILPTAVGFWL